VDTTGQGSGRRRRRNHSEQFKAEAVAACLQPGASIAAAAMSRSINANLLRRWVVEAERAQSGPVAPMARAAVAQSERFVALPISAAPAHDTPVRIEVRRGAMSVSVQWPRSAMHECAIWLRDLLK
jgi:transposase-like protein